MPAMQQMLVGVGGAYTFVNSEASTLVAAMTTQPDTTRKSLIDTLVGALKNGAISGTNIWNKLDVLQIYAAADSQAASLNWITPGSNTVTTSNSPTFTADRGYAGNGTNSFVNTNFTPSNGTKVAQNDCSYSIWSRTTTEYANTGNGGVDSVARRFSFNPRNTTDQYIYHLAEGAGTTLSGSTDGTGLYTGVRTAASVTAAYRNGSSIGTGSATSGGRTTVPLYMCAFNNNGTASSFVTRQYALFSMGQARTANEEADFYNAVQAYMTAIGA